MPSRCSSVNVNQIEDLAGVIVKDYGWEIISCVLDSKDNPKLELLMKLTAFVRANDKEGTLLIVYYAGHGFEMPPERSETGELEFMLLRQVKRVFPLSIANNFGAVRLQRKLLNWTRRSARTLHGAVLRMPFS